MTYSENFKTMAMVLLIAIAVIIKACPGHAAEQKVLTVAGGCFWCVESDFESLPGVVKAVSGYTGGKSKDPSYKIVTGGRSGHYESVQITFDPDVVTREKLLALFLRSIDPTDAGGQFCDRGDSYRSAIFVTNQAERTLAAQSIAKAQSDLGQNIVTPILPASEFYPAEDYHQDYYKGTKLVFTRFGPKRQSTAYKKYRKACGRDARVKQLWGSSAPFVGN